MGVSAGAAGTPTRFMGWVIGVLLGVVLLSGRIGRNAPLDGVIVVTGIVLSRRGSG
ncbi:hypothetical protein [Mycobacteroides sp. CBMA 271]|uniref:hypothetical protein n=1 Tax=Mycobacteroides sp. CBMA 271 TaxID=2606608 RepID=UPI0014130054|nr:hypothetical protein [Mycobacteroides sp. CBMA 271]